MHYISSDGYDIYVGKNNIQNDELTFSFANGGDWWFHAKGAPGSHVIVKTNGDELPDRTFEEAGRLAAYYSKNRGSDKVEIDYIERSMSRNQTEQNPGLWFIIQTTLSWLLRTSQALKKPPSLNWRAFLVRIYNFYFATKLTILFGT